MNTSFCLKTLNTGQSAVRLNRQDKYGDDRNIIQALAYKMHILILKLS